MLETEAHSPPAGAAPVLPRHPGPLPAPDRDVLDSARARLAPARHRPATWAQAATAAPEPATRHLPRPLDDLRAASAIAQQAVSPGQPPADPLDVGAALVLLGNVRLHVDRLEARLLELAQQAEMSWDLIAAIIGIPAAEGRDRLAALRERPEPQ